MIKYQVILFLFFTVNIFCQEKDTVVQTTAPDSLRLVMLNYLNVAEFIEKQDIKYLYVTSFISDYNYPVKYKDSSFGRGIYVFGLNISETHTYIIFVYDNYSKIISDYNFSNILLECSRFFETNNIGLVEQRKYLNGIWKMLIRRQTQFPKGWIRDNN